MACAYSCRFASHLLCWQRESGKGVLNPDTEFRASRQPPWRDRRTSPTLSRRESRRPSSSRFNRGVGGSPPMKVASMRDGGLGVQFSSFTACATSLGA